MELFRKLSPRNKRFICSAIAIAALSYAGAAIPGRISYSPTDSIGYRFFFLKKHFTPADLQPGTLVVLPMYTQMWPDCWPCLGVKYIKCCAGQHLEAMDNRFFCDGIYLGSAKHSSKTGIAVAPFEYNGIIPEGKIFLMGVTDDSYDSRYIGLERTSHVKAIALPLF